MIPHLVPAFDTGRLVFLSGQLPFNESREITETEISGQTRLVLTNVAKALKDAGLSLEDVVKTTVWIKNAADFALFDAAYAAMFGDHRPARSTVVSDLVVPAALVEIEAIALRPAGAGAKG